MGKVKQLLACMAFLLLFGAAAEGHATAALEKPQVILLFVEGMSFADLEQLKQYPHVDKWMEHAGAGALSIRPPGARTAANAYLLMGSGGQASYTGRSGTAYHPEEPLSPKETAGARVQELGGEQAQAGARSRIVFPGIFRLLAENRDKPFSARIGLLGSTLAARSISIAAYGNGDFDGTRNRDAVLFAMDERGRVPNGDLALQSTLSSAGSPYGVKTNYSFLQNKIRTDRESGLITVQLSDLARLYQLADDMEPGQFDRQYRRILSELSAFIGGVLDGRRANQTVVVLSPAVHAKAVQNKELLPPILVWRNGVSGLLTSATTRQSGLVSGLDVLPSVLMWLQVPVPEGLAGHAVRSEQGRDMAALMEQVEQIHHTYATRPAVLYTYVMLQMFTLASAALLWLWGRRRSGGGLELLRRGVRLALLAMLWFPILLLAEAMLPWQPSGAVILGVLIMATLLAAFLQINGSLPKTTAVISGVTVSGLMIDGWTGATLMKKSYLGYDAVIGARFYGLGNEYEGVLIGSTILFVASLYQLSRQKREEQARERSLVLAGAGASLFGIVLYYMAAPGLGTDAGGFLAGLVGFFVAFARLHGWQAGKKGLLLLAGGLVIGVAALMAASLLSDQPLTHIGRVSQQIVSGDWGEVARMVERKLAMNVRLIRVSIWSKVFVVSLVVLGLLSLRNDRFLRHLALDYPMMAKGFAGVIAGALAGLVLNDSGIVTAATCIIFLVVPALFAALGESADKHCST